MYFKKSLFFRDIYLNIYGLKMSGEGVRERNEGKVVNEITLAKSC